MARATRFLIALTAAALVVAACGDDTPASTTTTTDGATTTSNPPVGALADEFDELIEAAETVRNLQFLADPVITVVSTEELAERVRQDIEDELDPADLVIDQAFFELLGILPADLDLGQAITDLYSEQVAGFYDHETGELVVGGDTEMTALTKVIMVHELVHALTDQHFDLSTLTDLSDAERYHEASAYLTLVEGDATYFQIVYLQSLPVSEQLEAATEALEYDSTVLDTLPAWFGEDLSFPYDAGFLFVEDLVARGGSAAVDRAYQRIPTTVEQVIHPEVYRTFEPSREVTLPGNAIVPGYEITEEGELGEWNLRLYLLDGVEDADSIIGSAGWGGDDYRILWNGTDVAFAYEFQGDTPRDAEELAGLLAESVDARMAVGNGSTRNGATVFQGEDYAWILLDGSSVYFVAASDPAAGQSLAEVLTPVDG